MNFDALAGWEEAAEHVPPWTPGAPPRPALRLAWAAGCAPFVRVQGVEVVRISEMLAAHTIDALKERGHQPDPVLITLPRYCIEVLVPLASTTVWFPHRYTTCTAAVLMRCPAPEVTSGRWVAGRTWTRSPGTGLPLTNAHALAGAVPEALARWHDSLTARIEGCAGDRPTPGPHRKDTRP
ncbi:hypothetical protein [Streptomyces sp. NBC_00140]|uniref:hypothetical protein n=1 Tax=Streptomyces sp. NBC_00140 TaxID=2975664 RepID=UPI0022539582|nr:hypothetical protein [Streptomyces sp. NBC_00140]MCX5338295.1 hypothetical protein [Streptomyces sp. NBC_00140]